MCICSSLDGWGGRVDNLITCDAWKLLHDIASREKLVGIGHDEQQVSVIDFLQLKQFMVNLK
jgi:hypothetical protein